MALHVQATGGGYAHQRAATQERIVARYENFGKGLSATYGLPLLALGPLLLGIRKPYAFFATQQALVPIGGSDQLGKLSIAFFAYMAF